MALPDSPPWDEPLAQYERETGRRQQLEFWVQHYVRQNPEHLGFDRVKGPWPSGPDLRVIRDGLECLAEVEVKWENYLLHKHDQDARFDAVELLILLDPEEPPADVVNRLPREVLYVDVATFAAWVPKIVESDPWNLRLRTSRVHVNDVIEDDFDPEACPDRGREMCACCDGCPYREVL